MENQAILFERKFNAPVSKVWDAITNKDQMKLWYFDLPDFRPEVGCEFTFSGGHEDGIQYLHICRVTEVITGKKITYSWCYDGYPGNSFVTFELFEETDGTRLKLTHAGVETFDPKNPDFAKGNFVEGWNAIINTLLKEYLETTDSQTNN